MSEPSTNLDLTSLSDALGEEDRHGLAEEARQAKAGKGGEEKSDSPATLSPDPTSSPHSAPEVPATAQGAAPQSEAHAVDEVHPDPNVRNIKAMFPDLDVDTIQAVLVADGGDFERAINTLLQMSDPSYVPPPPFQQPSQQDQDEQLARSIAAQEEQRSARPYQPPSSRGGLGSFFGGGQQSPPQPSPSYNQNQLNYQPRIRRTPSSQQQQQQQPSSQPYQARQQDGGGPGPNDSMLVGWPGPKEAKVWQEDINRLAETGFAKAASTFSALRQRGERAFGGAASPQGGASDDGVGGGTAGVGGQQQQSSAPAWSARRASSLSTSGGASAVSPTIGSNRGFDQDPSPVGENELAKILARGSREEGRRPSVAERYKKVASANSRTSSVDKGDDGEEALGWGDAGRTGAKSGAGNGGGEAGAGASFEPIRISDNSTDGDVHSDQTKPKLPATSRNAVSLMESSTGRGLTSPRRSAAKEGKEEGDEDEGDDLEYVANPFEDDD